MSSTTTTSNAATPGSLVVRPVKPVRNLFYVFELCANCGFVYFEDAIYARNFRKDNAFYIRVERRFSSEQSYHDDMHKNESMIACFPGSQCLESTSFQRGFSRITQKPFAPVPQPPHCPSPEIRAQVYTTTNNCFTLVVMEFLASSEVPFPYISFPKLTSKLQRYSLDHPCPEPAFQDALFNSRSYPRFNSLPLFVDSRNVLREETRDTPIVFGRVHSYIKVKPHILTTMYRIPHTRLRSSAEEQQWIHNTTELVVGCILQVLSTPSVANAAVKSVCHKYVEYHRFLQNAVIRVNRSQTGFFPCLSPEDNHHLLHRFRIGDGPNPKYPEEKIKAIQRNLEQCNLDDTDDFCRVTTTPKDSYT